MHFNGRFVLGLARLAVNQGAEMEHLLALTGKSAAELAERDCRLDAKTYDNFLEAAVAATGDDYFGLHAGENMNLAAAGLIVQIVQSCGTVKEALEYCCEFSNLGCSALPATLIEETDHYRYTFTPDPVWLTAAPLSVRHTLEGYLAFSVREFQSITRSRRSPVAVWLSYPQPENPAELERVLGCPVYFGREQNTLILQKEHVEEGILHSDYELLKVLVEHAYRKLEEFQKQPGFYETVRHSVVSLLKPEFPGLEEVAAHLNMSVRSFQRRLKEEGHSYKEVIDGLRKDFALTYLRKPELSVGEIAYLLDYSEPSTFVRSFKRWTGQTPSGYRGMFHP